MFCRFCGTQMADDAKFCPKCGNSSGGNADKGSGSIERQQKTSGINMKMLITLAAIITVLLVVIVVKIISNSKTSDSYLAGSGKKSSSNERTTGDDEFSYDAIVEQCSDCNEAIAAYSDLMDSACEFGYDKDELNYLTDRYSKAMHHSCNADVIEVTNVPYVYRSCLGLYTGEWKGAGPFGVGKFSGTARFTDDIISYDGEWAYGLPEGEGYLYIQNFADSSWDLNYSGSFHAGMRNGTGYIYEYNKGGFNGPMYRIYDVATFENDIMTSTTDVEQYDADTKELLYSLRVTGEDSGWIIELDYWGANELDPEQRKMLEFAECALVGATAAAIIRSAYKGFTYKYDYDAANQQMQKELDIYNAEKEKAEQEMHEQMKRDAAEKANHYADEYNKAINTNDPEAKLWKTKEDRKQYNRLKSIAGQQ